MNNNNEKIEEFKNIELIKTIYKEIIEMKSYINNRTEEKTDKLSESLKKLKIKSEKIDDLIINIQEYIIDIKSTLEKHNKKIEEHDKKIENNEEKGIQERKFEIARLNSFNDYDKIILNNLESRISILEEENEKYTIN